MSIRLLLIVHLERTGRAGECERTRADESPQVSDAVEPESGMRQRSAVRERQSATVPPTRLTPGRGGDLHRRKSPRKLSDRVATLAAGSYSEQGGGCHGGSPDESCSNRRRLVNRRYRGALRPRREHRVPALG